MSDARKNTTKILEEMDEGLLEPRLVAEVCLSYMSEAEVVAMIDSYDLLPIPMEYDDE